MLCKTAFAENAGAAMGDLIVLESAYFLHEETRRLTKYGWLALLGVSSCDFVDHLEEHS